MLAELVKEISMCVPVLPKCCMASQLRFCRLPFKEVGFYWDPDKMKMEAKIAIQW